MKKANKPKINLTIAILISAVVYLALSLTLILLLPQVLIVILITLLTICLTATILTLINYYLVKPLKQITLASKTYLSEGDYYPVNCSAPYLLQLQEAIKTIEKKVNVLVDFTKDQHDNLVHEINSKEKFFAEAIKEIIKKLAGFKTRIKFEDAENIQEDVDIINDLLHRMKKEIKLNEVEELDETNPNIIDLSEKTILVVDDIDINRSILIETLKLGNAKVIDVENGQIAVDTFAKDYQTIDLILMDIRMPVMDGYEATRIIRTLNEKGKVIPIIAVSAHLYQKDIYKAFDAGMTDHLPKPIDVSKLYEIIARNIK